MTTPGGQLTPGDESNPPVYGVPDGAYVGTAGAPNAITDLNNLTESEAKARIQAEAIPSFNRQRDAAWGVFNDLAYALTGVQVDEFGNPITHLEDWAAGGLHNFGEVMQDYGTAIEDLGKNRVMPWAVPTVAPLSQSINRRADATFQLQGFMSLDSPIIGTSERTWITNEVGVYHTHGAGTYRANTRLAEGWNVANRTYLAFVTPSVTRLYNGIDFMVGATSGTPAVMDFALFRTDENRQLTSMIGVQRIEPAEVGTGRQVVSRTFTPTIVQQGEYIAIAVRQFSTGAQRALLGVNDVDRPLKNAAFPRKITATWNATSSIPSTINGETELDFTSDWFIPYIELSEDVGVDYKMFSETWGHDAIAPRPWVQLTNPGIFSDSGGYATASGGGYRASIYDTPLSTDYVRVRTSVHSVKLGDTSRRSTIIFRGTNNLTSGVGLSVIGNERYELIRWSGRDPGSDWDNRTVIATLNLAPGNGHTVEIDYLNGLVTVRINGVQRVSGISVGGPTGAAGRFVGVQTERTGSVFLRSPSPYIGAWSARDLPQENGDEGDDDEGEGS